MDMGKLVCAAASLQAHYAAFEVYWAKAVCSDAPSYQRFLDRIFLERQKAKPAEPVARGAGSGPAPDHKPGRNHGFDRPGLFINLHRGRGFLHLDGLARDNRRVDHRYTRGTVGAFKAVNDAPNLPLVARQR